MELDAIVLMFFEFFVLAGNIFSKILIQLLRLLTMKGNTELRYFRSN